MKNLADHLFDIIENSVNANAKQVSIEIGYKQNWLFCSIRDDGSGISGPEVVDPFVTSRKTRRVGLGLPLLKKAVEDTGGYLKIKRLNDEGGTYLEFKMNMSHIDAKPPGDIANAFIDMLFAWPEVRVIVYILENDSKRIIFDSWKYSNVQEVENFLEIRNKVYISLMDELEMISFDEKD